MPCRDKKRCTRWGMVYLSLHAIGLRKNTQMSWDVAKGRRKRARRTMIMIQTSHPYKGSTQSSPTTQSIFDRCPSSESLSMNERVGSGGYCCYWSRQTRVREERGMCREVRLGKQCKKSVFQLSSTSDMHAAIVPLWPTHRRDPHRRTGGATLAAL